MAERRMFSKKVIDTDAFIEMSISARLLYYDLAMRADDDGFVSSPKVIIRMIGCSEEDLRLLITKKFVIQFESGVCVITHWKRNNYIPKDRYTPTQYIEERRQLAENNGVYTTCIPDVHDSVYNDVYNPYTQDRLDKDRLGKDSIGDISSPSDDPRVDYAAVVELFNSICKSRPKVKQITDKRRAAIKARLSELDGDMDKLREVFEAVQASPFLSGRNGKWTGCCFDWVMKASNFVKISEGTYRDSGSDMDKPDYTDPSRYAHAADEW